MLGGGRCGTGQEVVSLLISPILGWGPLTTTTNGAGPLATLVGLVQ